MKRTDQLSDLLTSLTALFNDGEPLTVEFDSSAYARPDGTVVVAPNVREAFGRNLSGADELRVLVDTLGHEVEHVRRSDLTGKRTFMEQYPAFPNVAGAAINVLEDVFIDARRFERYPGLRLTHAFKVDSLMGNHTRRPRLDSLDSVPQRMVEGMVQVAFAGYAKGFDSIPRDQQETLARVRLLAKEARNTHSVAGREQLAHRVTRALIAHFPEMNGDDLDELEKYIDGLPTDDVDAPPADTDAVDEHNKQVRENEAAGGAADTDSDNAAESEQSDAGGDGDGELTETDEEAPDDADATPAAPDAEPDLDAEIDAMLEQDGDRSAADWFDADPADYEQADELDEQRYDALQQAIRDARSDLGKRQSERDKKAETDDENGWWVESAEAQLYNTGLAQEVEDAFHRLVTQDFEEPDEEGHALNMDAIVRRRAGDYTENDLFFSQHVAETGDRTVAVALDMSGSMPVVEAGVALGALALATEAVGDEFAASAFTSSRGGRGSVRTPLITAPGERFEWDQLKGVGHRGSTPTPSGIVDARTLLEQGTKREKVLLVVTDGKANTTLNGSGNSITALNEARDLVDQTRAEGTVVIGLGVGYVEEGYLARMFGEDGYVKAEKGELCDALIECYSSQMKTGSVSLR